MKKNHWLFFLLYITAIAASGFSSSKSTETPAPAPAPAITYFLSMPQPQTHYFEVEMRIRGASANFNQSQNGYVDVKMPVWTPGSYLIREYAKNVEGFRALQGNQPVRSEKIRKNTWRVYATADPITIRYKVYAYELSVRTSFVDASHGYLNGASIFLYVDQLRNRPHQLVIQPFMNWHKITTGLPPVSNQPNTYESPDYDVLVDSPIEIGNHHTFTFIAAGVPHTVAMYGDKLYNENRLSEDMKRVCEEAAKIIGEHPCKDYTFIIHQTPTGGGGLEHANSSTLQITRNAFLNAQLYQNLLSLVAHEYFHLWNVKRIRPKALGPFDYENENYTHLLWVSEGITSFYQSMILKRSGFLTSESYLRSFASEISGIENAPGNEVQSVAESSFDAWIKYYRPTENSINSTVSYYSKGSVLGSLLNLAIVSNTDGQKNLDDVMRLLYSTYYRKLKRGFTDDEFQQAVETVAGQKLDDFFRDYVFGTARIDYNTFLNPVGLKLVDASASKEDAYLGAMTKSGNGKLIVSAVRRDSPAWIGGLNVNDEILSIDSLKTGANLDKILETFKPDDTVTILVNRSGQILSLPITLTGNPLAAYRIEPVENPSVEQRALYRKWLSIKST
ncbi:M61 family metallopeptidase [Larkinella rosea]|uniref:M61 family peptidase n=1 Tax=Larkinella rosea TaxID=2025312 RepID=A0A3P1C0R0_9BACT|nr:PDZ domain-containing protein [Larkinella rosea]RRB06927.1 M61 family peptidase [Larkinella rosea]